MQAPKKITVTSVSCPTGRNNDCGILTLIQFLGNHMIFKTYDEITTFLKTRMAEFGLPYDPNTEQMGKDLFEAALLEFLPDYQVELYKLIWRDQRREVSVEIINAGEGHIKSQYRLILISSWDRKRNTVGAGHFALLNTGLATIDQIVTALTKEGYDEERFTMQNQLSCSFCMAKLVSAEARACGNRRDCQTLYCNDQCAQRAWPRHYRVCSSMTLIKASGSPPGEQQTREAQMAEIDVQRYKDRVQLEREIRNAKKREAEQMLKDAKRQQEHEEKMRAQDAEIAALKRELELLRNN